MARARRHALRERWSGWKREPFTSESTKHVSVWEKPGALGLGGRAARFPGRWWRARPNDL